MTVDGTLCSPESGPVTLHSQDSISVADQTFFFLLPKDVRRDRARAAARANLQKYVNHEMVVVVVHNLAI